jgi:hypothetical protein
MSDHYELIGQTVVPVGLALCALVGFLVGVDAKAATGGHEGSAAFRAVAFVENVEIANLRLETQDHIAPRDSLESRLGHPATQRGKGIRQRVSSAYSHCENVRRRISLFQFDSWQQQSTADLHTIASRSPKVLEHEFDLCIPCELRMGGYRRSLDEDVSSLRQMKRAFCQFRAPLCRNCSSRGSAGRFPGRLQADAGNLSLLLYRVQGFDREPASYDANRYEGPIRPIDPRIRGCGGALMYFSGCFLYYRSLDQWSRWGRVRRRLASGFGTAGMALGLIIFLNPMGWSYLGR